MLRGRKFSEREIEIVKKLVKENLSKGKRMERKGVLKLPPSCRGGYREIKKIEIKRGLFNNFEIIKGKINKHAKLEACSTSGFCRWGISFKFKG